MGTQLISNPYIAYPQIPVGIPFFWPTEANWPDGTLEMRGQTFSATDYPELALKYPSLTLPDMRGVVARGLDRGSGRNSDAVSATAGTYQTDETKSHNHALYAGQTAISQMSNNNPVMGATTYTGTNTTGQILPTGGTETRGKAVLGYWLCFARTMLYDLNVEGGNAYMLGGHPASYYVGKQDIANDITTRPWIIPTLLNGWVAYGGIYSSPKYYIDSIGIVHLKGAVKSGTISSTIFTLPNGYRPDAAISFPVVSNNAFGICNILSDGSVNSSSSSNTIFTLDGISFRAEG
jgi:hypothetical protein